VALGAAVAVGTGVAAGAVCPAVLVNRTRAACSCSLSRVLAASIASSSAAAVGLGLVLEGQDGRLQFLHLVQHRGRLLSCVGGGRLLSCDDGVGEGVGIGRCGCRWFGGFACEGVFTEAGHDLLDQIGIVEAELVYRGGVVSDGLLGIAEVCFELWPSIFCGGVVVPFSDVCGEQS
jgi:hypothetical protein